jgi:hypothetical protein
MEVPGSILPGSPYGRVWRRRWCRWPAEFFLIIVILQALKIICPQPAMLVIGVLDTRVAQFLPPTSLAR